MESHSSDLGRDRFEEIAAHSADSTKMLEESRRERLDIEARLRASRRALDEQRRSVGPVRRLLAYFQR